MIELNKGCNLDYDRQFYKSLPAKALNLLQGLLDPDPALRLTAEQALKHSYLTGIESLPQFPQPMAHGQEQKPSQCEILSEDVNNSEEDLKILENNRMSLKRMDKSCCHMLEDIMSQYSNTPPRITLDSTKKNFESNKYMSIKEPAIKHLDQQISIVIRVPVITGRMNSISSNPNKEESENQEDYSPVLKKEIKSFKEKRKILNFTLLACDASQN